MTSIYLALAERLGIPLAGVYVPSHCFVRYEGNGARINIETGEEGAEHKDSWYEKRFRLKEGSPYLRTMDRRQVIGMYLKSLGAAYSIKGRDKEALALYREAALFSPELPDAYYNAGVSYQKLGKTDDAIAQYRQALALDPFMAPARGNLASVLCGCGKGDEGIREFHKTLEIDPGNALAHSGLAKAYFARRDFVQAARHCDRAMEKGCRFEPSMLEVLNKYLKPANEFASGP
jgi:tetratricopeptide (TPR) repeat protein